MQRLGWEWHSQTRGMLEISTLSLPQLPAFNCAILGEIFQPLNCRIPVHCFGCLTPLQSCSVCLDLFLLAFRDVMSACLTSSWHTTSGHFASPADVGQNSQEASKVGTPNIGSQDELDQRSLQSMENFPKALSWVVFKVSGTSRSIPK